MSSKFRYLDYWILIPYLILLGIGIVMVYSASFDTVMVHGGAASSYFIKQMMYASIGLVSCVIVFMLKINKLKSLKLIQFFLFITIILLIYLLIRKKIDPTSAINGASAWINVGFFNIQPLEIAKLTLILYFSFIFSRRQERLVPGNIIQELSGPLIIGFVILLLVIFQPDFGGTGILFFIGIVLISTSGIPKKSMALMNAVWIIPMSIVYYVLTHNHFAFLQKYYQYRRFMAFKNPFKYESGIGSQLVNSLYAINNGGWFGVGLGNSIQKRGYLPEPYTDFILSITSEELGFVGVLLILGLLFTIMFRCIQIGIKSTDTFRSLLVFGVAAMLFAQTFLNVGGLLGLIPLTGVTLPFISYGGSSLIILSISIGIVLNVSASEKFQEVQNR
ncbi:FtsW/RodA/SpoVE family cell cycle protein [Companilactobacillus sp. DQM5]|uniref:FtsW/RodA/SpoVE family cell cycle protein n=1 Tax=Companilactobacillus sp. DQM5 TaxID=3463359 RepID=UPI004059C75D